MIAVVAAGVAAAGVAGVAWAWGHMQRIDDALVELPDVDEATR